MISKLWRIAGMICASGDVGCWICCGAINIEPKCFLHFSYWLWRCRWDCPRDCYFLWQLRGLRQPIFWWKWFFPLHWLCKSLAYKFSFEISKAMSAGLYFPPLNKIVPSKLTSPKNLNLSYSGSYFHLFCGTSITGGKETSATLSVLLKSDFYSINWIIQ